MAPKTLNEREAAQYLNVSQSFLRQDRMNGVRENRTPGPPFVRIGRKILYLREDLDGWLDKHRVERGGTRSAA